MYRSKWQLSPLQSSQWFKMNFASIVTAVFQTEKMKDVVSLMPFYALSCLYTKREWMTQTEDYKEICNEAICPSKQSAKCNTEEWILHICISIKDYFYLLYNMNSCDISCWAKINACKKMIQLFVFFDFVIQWTLMY